MKKVYNVVCELCGEEFKTGSNRTKYCVECRKIKQRERNMIYKQNKQDGNVRRLGSTQLCDICKKPFTVNSGAQRTCDKCNSGRKSVANTKYRNNTYDQVVFYVKKGEREKLKEYAISKNMSMNEFVNKAIASYKKLLKD